MNNLSLAVSADVTDLVAKSAVAKAEVRALTSEMNNLAKASAAGMGPEVAPALQQVAGELVRAKAEAAALSAEMKEMQGASVNVGKSVEEMHEQISNAFQVTGIAAAAEAVNLVREAIDKTVESARQISVGADTLGVNVEQFQAMQHAAEEAGVGQDTLAHASERLQITLNEARNNSSAAIEKLYTLGVTAEQIKDPMFGIIQLLGVEKERLENGSTAVDARNALLQVLGTRMASAISAIKEFDGSEAGINKTMRETLGYAQQEVDEFKQLGGTMDTIGTAAEHAVGKLVLFEHSVLSAMAAIASPQQAANATLGKMGFAMPDPSVAAAAAQQAAQARVQAAQTAEAQEQALNNLILKQEMENARAGVEAFKQGTEQKLAQLQTYAAAAAKYLGSDSADTVVKANQQIIAEQTAVTEHQQAELQKQRGFIDQWGAEYDQISNEVKATHERNTLDMAKATADEIKEEKAQANELYNGWTQTYTEINNFHRSLLQQENADTQKAVKADATAWKGVVGEIESAEGSMVNDILTKRKSLSQSLVALGAQLVTSEITNDIRAITTRTLLQSTAATQQRALEQGGVLYHMAANAQQTASTAQSQSAQTSAVVAGNTARVSATISADSAAHAASAATGGATVMADAAKAFSGTYASVSQIPYVGWILAPIAASAAYAGVAAYEGLASLDTGTNFVPRDMLANIHEGEAVVPRQYNPAANPAAAFAGGGGDTHNYGGFNINAPNLDLRRMLSDPGNRRMLINTISGAVRRGAR